MQLLMAFLFSRVAHRVAESFDKSMETKDDTIYRRIGHLLCYLHGVEEVMTWVVWLMDCSIDKTVRPFEDYDRKTLGTLMRTVREKVSVDEEFAKTFSRFLDARNQFIHGFATRCRLDDGPQKRDELMKFLAQLSDDAKKVKGVFLRYLIQAFSLWDDECREEKIVEKLRNEGYGVPDRLLDTIFGPFSDPLNIEFKR